MCRKTLVWLLAAICIIVGCRPEFDFLEGSYPGGNPELDYSGGNIYMAFTSSAGSASVSLEASKKWKASFVNDRAKDWCSLSLDNGKRGTATIQVSVKENTEYDERSASIIFECDDIQRTIVVTQKQKDALLVSGSRFDIEKEGGRIDIEVKANVNFEYSVSDESKSWIKPKETKGLSSSVASFSVSPNESFAKREGEILFTCQLGTERVKVYQDCDHPTIVLSSDNYSLNAEPGEFTVDVRSNFDVTFRIPADCDWIHEVTTKAMSTNSFSFSVDENETFTARSATLVFRSEEWGVEEKVTVTQKAATPTIIIGTGEYQVGPEGGSLDVILKSNMDLQIGVGPEGCDWIVPVETKALTERTHSFSVSRNHGRSARSGWITFFNSQENSADTVYVSQSFQHILVSCDTLPASGRGWSVSFETVGPNPSDYRIEPVSDWLSLKTQEQLSDRSRFTVAVKQNEGSTDREGEILVYYSGYDVPDTVYVHQYQPFPSFSFTTPDRIVKLPEIEGEDQLGFVFWGDDTVEPYRGGLSHEYNSSGWHKIIVEMRSVKRVSVTNLHDGMTVNLRELRDN